MLVACTNNKCTEPKVDVPIGGYCTMTEQCGTNVACYPLGNGKCGANGAACGISHEVCESGQSRR
jgi:hypothetical protein